jgi:hypothetical protein
MRGASESHRASGDERLPWCRSQRRAADIRPWARGCHQLTDEIGSLHLVKTGIRHRPEAAADDEATPVWLHDTLG